MHKCDASAESMYITNNDSDKSHGHVIDIWQGCHGGEIFGWARKFMRKKAIYMPSKL